MECIACPISWKRFSIIPGVSNVGEPLLHWGKLSIMTTTGSWYSPFSCSLPPRIVKWQSYIFLKNDTNTLTQPLSIRNIRYFGMLTYESNTSTICKRHKLLIIIALSKILISEIYQNWCWSTFIDLTKQNKAFCSTQSSTYFLISFLVYLYF